jgi:hypothetical protein
VAVPSLEDWIVARVVEPAANLAIVSVGKTLKRRADGFGLLLRPKCT